MSSDAATASPVTSGASLWAKAIFVAAALFCLTAYASPGIALAAGLAIGLDAWAIRFPCWSRRPASPCSRYPWCCWVSG